MTADNRPIVTPIVPDRDPEITSTLSRTVSQNGMAVDVQVFRRATSTAWTFVVVNETGTSFHSPDDFVTIEEALLAFEAGIAAHGIESYRDDAPCPLCKG